MIDVVSNIALFFLILTLVAAMYRIVVGPTVADRVVALDAMTVHVLGIIIVYAIKRDTTDFLDSALVIGILSFLSTVVIAKFMKKGVTIERDTD